MAVPPLGVGRLDAEPSKLAVPSVLSEQEASSVRARYQRGSLTKLKRKCGRLVWLFRWRETRPDGTRRP